MRKSIYVSTFFKKRLFVLLLLVLFIYIYPTLAQQNSSFIIPSKFDDYRLVTNSDSLEQVVYAQKNNPAAYLHGLIRLEMSRYNMSDKFGQDLETIKTLSELQGSALGLVMYDYVNEQILLKKNLEEAAQTALRIVRYFESKNDTLGMIMGYGYLLKSNISSEYIVWGDLSKAKAYYSKIMELSKNNVNVQVKIQAARIYLVFSKLVTGENDLKKAMPVFEEAVNLINKNPQYEYWRALLYTHIGTPLLENKAYSKLLNYNLKAYQLYGNSQLQVRIPDIYNVGNAYRLNEKYKDAEKYFLQAIELYKKTNADKLGLLSQIYGRLSATKYMQKEYDKAWGYRNTADSLNDLNHKKVKSKELLDIQIKYETEKKELENNKLKLESEKQQQKAGLLGFLAILFILISGITVWTYRRVKGKNTELMRLNALIAQQNQDLTAANRRMEHFTNTLSHDALGYISNILSYTNLGQNMSNQTEFQPIFKTIFRNTSRLRDMSENLINYNKKRQITNFQKINIKNVIQEAIEDTSKTLSEEETHIEIDDTLLVYANREFVKEMMRNLIGNAVKFRKAIPLKISISAQYYLDNFILISVQDNGIGISDEKLPHIFNEFVKLDDGLEGSGLGLFICKQIVEGMGGEIWVESKEGEGSTFFFTLLRAPLSKLSQKEQFFT